MTQEEKKIGDYGYFWENETKCFVFGQLLEILDFANPEIFLYKVQVNGIYFHFEYFSKLPPLHMIDQ